MAPSLPPTNHSTYVQHKLVPYFISSLVVLSGHLWSTNVFYYSEDGRGLIFVDTCARSCGHSVDHFRLRALEHVNRGRGWIANLFDVFVFPVVDVDSRQC